MSSDTIGCHIDITSMSSSPYPQVELLSLDSALALGALVARSPMQRSMPPPSPISALSQSSSSAANPGGAAAVMAHRGGGHGHGNADGIIADDVGGASLRVGALPLPAPLTHTLTVGDDAALRLLRFARCVRRLREAVRAGACDINLTQASVVLLCEPCLNPGGLL